MTILKEIIINASENEVECIRRLQDKNIYFCQRCFAKTQGTYLTPSNDDVYVVGCTECNWRASYVFKSKTRLPNKNQSK